MILIALFGGHFCFGQTPKARKTYLNIGSFNVYLFGGVDAKYKEIRKVEKDPDYKRPDSTFYLPKRVINCAKILSKGELDLIAFQEVVAGDRGDSVMRDLASILNSKYNRKYKWFTSDPIGKGFKITECMGFLYDSTKVDLLMQDGKESTLMACDESKNRKYAKTCWKSGNLDFTLISCHFAWNDKNPERRQADYKWLNDILHNPSKYSNDPDVLVIGDFNRLGGKMKMAENDFGVQHLNVDTTKFRAPHIEVFDKNINRLKEVKDNIEIDHPQEHSTTVSDNNTVVYDVAWLTEGLFNNYRMHKARWNLDFGVDFVWTLVDFGISGLWTLEFGI